jgi:hypothetical protein
MQDNNTTNSNNSGISQEVRDLVEPVTIPRFRELVLQPWLDVFGRGRAARGMLERNEHEDDRSYHDENRCRELQLVGIGNMIGGGGGDDGSDDYSAVVENSLLGRLTALFTAGPANDPNFDGTAKAFRSFLFNDQPQTVVVWISRDQFLLCDGPTTLSMPVDHPYVVLTGALHIHWTEFGRGTYELWLGRIPSHYHPYWAARDGAWAPVLVALIACQAECEWIFCDLNVSLHARFLEAIVSPEPAPGSRRGIQFFPRRGITEYAARVIAFRTHRDTTVEISLNEWGRQGASILAESVRTNQCPKRLHLVGGTSDECVAPVADALRIATAVEELHLCFDPVRPNDEKPEADRCTRLLLDAIGDNVGLRTLSVRAYVCDAVVVLTKDLWSAVLRSRTLAKIDVWMASIDSPEARREVALHVAHRLTTNRVVTHIRYNPGTYDPVIMEGRVLPLLQLNRLRARAAQGGHQHYLAAYLGSEPVRQHAVLRYHLLRSSVETLARHLRVVASSSSSSRLDDE